MFNDGIHTSDIEKRLFAQVSLHLEADTILHDQPRTFLLRGEISLELLQGTLPRATKDASSALGLRLTL